MVAELALESAAFSHQAVLAAAAAANYYYLYSGRNRTEMADMD